MEQGLSKLAASLRLADCVTILHHFGRIGPRAGACAWKNRAKGWNRLRPRRYG